jgi:hypothetical protein
MQHLVHLTTQNWLWQNGLRTGTWSIERAIILLYNLRMCSQRMSIRREAYEGDN